MSFFDKAKDAFDDIKDKVTGKGDGASGTIDDAADRAKDRVGDSIDSAADSARDRANDAADTAANQGAGLVEQAGDTAAKGIDSAGDLADSASGGRFSEHIDNVENTAEGFVDKDGSAGTRER